MTTHSIGQQLRELRANDGMRQVDVAQVLGLSRSALANIEGGREAPSPRVLEAVARHYPVWSAHLAGHLSGAGAATPGGPFVLEDLTIAYVFAESRSPSEIVEARRVRATRSGPSHYVLSTQRTSDPVEFVVDSQALWGGYIAEEGGAFEEGHATYRRVFRFGRQLDRSERHSFAVRSWVERDPDPDNCVLVAFTIPAESVSLHLACHGSQQIERAWSFGPRQDDDEVTVDHPDSTEVEVSVGGTASVSFKRPELGMNYGLAWSWRERNSPQ